MLRSPGFTLLELLITLIVGLVLLTLAVPAFTSLVLDSRLTSAVNRRQCTEVGRWETGVIVFVNRDGDDPPRVDAGEPILQVEGALPVGSILANRNAFVFRPWGRSVNGTLTFCDRRGAARARAVVVSYTGRPRATSAGDADGALKCPA